MSLFSALAVSASGMAAQRTRAELLTENLANAETTRTPDGGPYRRKDAVFVSTTTPSDFHSVFVSQLGQQPQGVAVSEVVVDSRDPVMRYLPGHPDADGNGYVGFPHVNPAEDMVDLMSTGRNYQANVAAISAVKDMIQRSLDILR
jgi:flagellar basal-body rod protein FlgC